MQVSVQQGTSAEIFASIKSEWQSLFSRVDCPAFLSWEWMSVWFESFGEGRSPFIVKAYDRGKLVGILPMYLENLSFFGMSAKTLSLMGDDPGGADDVDLIAMAGDKPVIIAAIFDFLKRTVYHRVRFGNVAGDSETIGILRTIRRSKDIRFPRLTEKKIASCPQIDLQIGWEAILYNSRRKSNFTRKLKRLEKMENFEYRTITSHTLTGEAFERFLLLHEKRWEGAGGSELTGHPRLIDFQRRIVAELSSAGLIRFDELWVEGECRASIYGLDDGKTFCLYNSGYNPDFAHLSVGLVLLGLSIKAANDRGNTLYNFLRGDETYKFDWSNKVQDLVCVNLTSNAFPLVASEWIGNGMSALRTFSKSALPLNAKESLANWRRAWKRNYLLSEREPTHIEHSGS